MLAFGCPFHTCALKKKKIEFCWNCEEKDTCVKWKKQRDYSKDHDTFITYQQLEPNIEFIQKHGIEKFVEQQKAKEKLLKKMLENFNEGRSKTFYCIAAALLPIQDLEDSLNHANREALGKEIKEKSKILHALLEQKANTKKVILKLRK